MTGIKHKKHTGLGSDNNIVDLHSNQLLKRKQCLRSRQPEVTKTKQLMDRNLAGYK